MSKKRFELNQNINRGFSKLVKLSENYQSPYDMQVIDIKDINVDSTNPRKLSVTVADIESAQAKVALSPSDDIYFEELLTKLSLTVTKDASDREKRLAEHEKLLELAISIQKSGLLHPILVHKVSDKYFIVAGERRYLAHVILRKQHIEARSFKEKPSGLDIKMAQWVENIQRHDLTLYSKLLNIKDIAAEYKNKVGEEITPSILSQISGISKSQGSKYLGVLKAPLDVLSAIELADIRDLESALIVAKMDDPKERERLVNSIKCGLGRDKVKIAVKKVKEPRKKGVGRGRKASRVNLGYTKNTKIIKAIIGAILEKHQLNEITKELSGLDWENYEEVTKAFKKLLSTLEKELRYD